MIIDHVVEMSFRDMNEWLEIPGWPTLALYAFESWFDEEVIESRKVIDFWNECGYNVTWDDYIKDEWISYNECKNKLEMLRKAVKVDHD